MVSSEKSHLLKQLLHEGGPGGAESLADADRAVALARWLLERSRQLQTNEELAEQADIDRLVRHPADKATLVEMTDQAFRAHDPARIADQMAHVLQERGIPHSFSSLDRALLAGFRTLGPLLPAITVPLVLNKMRREAEGKVLHAETSKIRDYLSQRHREGVRINLNFLGEAVLSEAEAGRRLEHYLEALALPEVECISVKISTIYSQVSSLAHESTICTVGDRLERLLRTAHASHYRSPNGRTTPKFVYLDMEEYRDMHLTVAALQNALNRPGMEKIAAGVALQAYLPDAALVLEQLVQWAIARRDSGGAPLTIRLVKGANMEMERVEAAIEGWPQAPFTTKLETDANWKRMLRRMLRIDTADALRIGVASHNLFDISLAIVWGAQANALNRMQFEMLEGMADHQRRALSELVDDLLLYAPACREHEFVNAIGYLIRRLDENTLPENFLRHAFALEPDNAAWQQLESSFRQSLDQFELVAKTPRRTQNRLKEQAAATIPPVADHWSRYTNEPNTDWSLPQNVRWWESIRERWERLCDDRAIEIPLCLEESSIGEHEWTKTYDPSRPNTVVCRYQRATAADVARAVQRASADASGWRSTSSHHRHDLLRNAAERVRSARGELLAAALACGGKTVLESDPEVSEAIDFIEFYALTANDLYQRRALAIAPRGVVAVISPWNFPVAIPCGGIAAALAAGNSVLLKPASDTVLTAALLCQCFWDAGIPRDALQLIPCSSEVAGPALVANSQVDSVILTGGTETAAKMLALRPDLDLWAETGGKNAMIVTRLADHDLAIKHALQSAFGHAGQKCSATSLLLLERQVYEDPKFRQSLVEAAASLKVGSAWDPVTRIGPLIRPPTGALLRGLTTLDPQESWALQPQPLNDNPRLWSPGIKWDVLPGSFTHLTELFGPVLAVLPFDNLEEAIELVHATGYGLTSGLQSLDDREQAYWSEHVRAGNLYINRPTTGAVVLRQPFGGIGKSAFGAGIKAGGPNYLVPLLKISDQAEEKPAATADFELTAGRLMEVAAKYAQVAKRLFNQQHDYVMLLGQDNFCRSQAISGIVIRFTVSDDPYDAARALATSHALAMEDVYISISPTVSDAKRNFLERLVGPFGEFEFVVEPVEQLSEWVSEKQVQRVRYLSADSVEPEVRAACHEHFVSIVNRPVTNDGRVELLWYTQEKSLSRDYHRYGNLGRRAGELRR